MGLFVSRLISEQKLICELGLTFKQYTDLHVSRFYSWPRFLSSFYSWAEVSYSARDALITKQIYMVTHHFKYMYVIFYIILCQTHKPNFSTPQINKLTNVHSRQAELWYKNIVQTFLAGRLPVNFPLSHPSSSTAW